MGSPITAQVPDSSRRIRIWLGLLLLVAGLSGHLFAAQAIAGTHVTYYVAYRDHILGFAILTLASLVIVAPLGWRFWKGRSDLSVLIVGATQAVIGLLIYIERFHV